MGLYKIGRIRAEGLIGAGLLCAGLWECGLGWAQLLGFTPSLHSQYAATGSFYNPGPFCGFLAMLLPLAFYYTIRGRAGCLHRLGLVYLVTAAGIMPALMGRTGWIAAAAGCALVAGGCGRLPRLRPKAWLPLVLAAALVAAFLIRLKPASALGRLLLWRIGLDAAMARPLTGSGWDGVAGALGDAQEAYFTAAPDSVFAGVAGTPEYAFNEFLQIGIAFGIPAMALFTAVLAAATAAAWRGGAFGIAGGLAAFATVCLSSYPLQFPEFIAAVAAMIAGALAVSGLRCPVKAAAGLCLICGTVAACHHQIKRNDESDRWRQQRYICRYRLEPRQIHRLDSLYGMYSHSAEFLFDYGKALRETKLYEKSTAVLADGLAVSSDPMFLNLMGRNHHDLGQYEEAERCFRRSIHRLPGRMYPHYLLCLLYADPNVSDTVRFNAACAETLTMEPKVMSPAINRIRKELKALSVRLSPAKVGGCEDYEIYGNNHDEEN